MPRQYSTEALIKNIGVNFYGDNKEKMNEEIAQLFIDTVNENPNCVLGLATGSTPEGVYKLLVEAYNKKEVSFENVKSYNLDEYVGLEETHNQSYRYFMNSHLFNHIDIKLENTHIPSNKDDENNLEIYDQKIKEAGGIDIQILGIGSNGHIAFNEPGTSFNSNTHIVTLKESTISDNSRFFNSIDEVPKQAITMGLNSIMQAKRIILIAFGKNKQDAIYKMMALDPSEELPASFLQNHPNVTIYCDEDAASLLVDKIA